MSDRAKLFPVLTEDDCTHLVQLLVSRKVRSALDAAALVHALVDLSESMNRIHTEVLRPLIESDDPETPVVEDAVTDMIGELRHIDYHLHDAQLT